MAGFTTLTPEQRREFGRKGAARRAANRRAAAADKAPAAMEGPEVAKPLKLPEDNYDEFDGLLTDAEKAEIEEEARKKARLDQKKEAKAAYVKEALAKARRDLGTLPATDEFKEYLTEEMTVYVDMPRMRKPTGGDHPPDPIILDQTVYQSGRHYKLPRAQALYLLYVMDQARRHANQVDGRSQTYYHPGTGQMVYQGGTAVGGGSLGSSFDALHKRPPG